MSGLIADSKTMIDKARVEAQVFLLFLLNLYHLIANLFYTINS